MRQKGIDGEVLALNYLKDKGYKIIARNFHSRFGEIDIIVKNRDTIVFVEVKLRTNLYFGTPIESVTHSKVEKMKKTAFYFLTLNNLPDSNIRFDVIEVFLGDKTSEINHVENITL